ncbi:hypothetical protein [Deinococcus arenicola]|uniref:Cyclic nucleotide-binding domain-containing protein n=1 Tax=Deinococcus arenicola TaxID=2994950 RepID=A0ABU4DQR6_9DEIO|nr:hypothetical protein [Deinococcus sp. ZS9-10]MDV6374771.1 hypothetical protein [Deinococcus sp. ZS9-10]
MTSEPVPESAQTITLTPEQWQAFQDRLYERDDRLELRTPDTVVARGEAVDVYILSGHAEALRSGDVDGDVWGTLEDLDETARDEEEAWEKIVAFYQDRGSVMVRVTGLDEPEEWLFTAELAQRLELPDQGRPDQGSAG